jgi:hypothetical protein
MFLKTLYQRWRMMFWIVLGFIALQAFFAFKGIQNTPFFLFNMYSTRQQNKDTTYKIRLLVNNKAFNYHSLMYREAESLIGSFEYFERLQQTDFHATDPQLVKARLENKLPRKIYGIAFNRLTNAAMTKEMYLAWWLKYLEAVTGETINTVQVVRTPMTWQPNPKWDFSRNIILLNYAK